MEIGCQGVRNERRLGIAGLEKAFIKHWQQEISVEDSLRKAKGDRDSLDVIAIGCWWTNCGSEPGGWGADFPQTSISDPRTILAYQRFLQGLKRPGCGVDHTPHLQATFKKK
jgi:hypothetical protein